MEATKLFQKTMLEEKVKELDRRIEFVKKVRNNMVDFIESELEKLQEARRRALSECNKT